MSLLSKLLPVANVILDLDVTSKKRVFEHVGLLFENALGIGRSQVFDACSRASAWARPAWARASPFRTAASRVCARRRARSFAPRQPIPFEAPDGNPVNLIFVLLVPEKRPTCTCRSSPSWRRCSATRSCARNSTALPDAADVQRLISEWEPHAPSQRRAAV